MNIFIALRNFIGNAAVVCIAAAAVITLAEMILYKIKARNARDDKAGDKISGSDGRKDCR